MDHPSPPFQKHRDETDATVVPQDQQANTNTGPLSPVHLLGDEVEIAVLSSGNNTKDSLNSVNYQNISDFNVNVGHNPQSLQPKNLASPHHSPHHPDEVKTQGFNQNSPGALRSGEESQAMERVDKFNPSFEIASKVQQEKKQIFLQTNHNPLARHDALVSTNSSQMVNSPAMMSFQRMQSKVTQESQDNQVISMIQVATAQSKLSPHESGFNLRDKTTTSPMGTHHMSQKSQAQNNLDIEQELHPEDAKDMLSAPKNLIDSIVDNMASQSSANQDLQGSVFMAQPSTTTKDISGHTSMVQEIGVTVIQNHPASNQTARKEQKKKSTIVGSDEAKQHYSVMLSNQQQSLAFQKDQSTYKYFMNRQSRTNREVSDKLRATTSQMSSNQNQPTVGPLRGVDSYQSSRGTSRPPPQQDERRLMVQSRGINKFFVGGGPQQTSQEGSKVVIQQINLSYNANQAREKGNNSSQGTNSFGGFVNKRNTLKSQRTGSFGGNIPFELSKQGTDYGQPLNVTRKHITQVPRLLDGVKSKAGSSYGPRAKTRNQDVLDAQNDQHLKVASQSHFSTGLNPSAGNTKEEALSESLLRSRMQSQGQEIYTQNLLAAAEDVNQFLKPFDQFSRQTKDPLNSTSTGFKQGSYQGMSKGNPLSKENTNQSIERSSANNVQQAPISTYKLENFQSSTHYGSSFQNASPRVRAVPAPGGFAGRIKKRTQSMMSYNIFLKNKRDPASMSQAKNSPSHLLSGSGQKFSYPESIIEQELEDLKKSKRLADGYRQKTPLHVSHPSDLGQLQDATRAGTNNGSLLKKLTGVEKNIHHYKNMEILKVSGLLPKKPGQRSGSKQVISNESSPEMVLPLKPKNAFQSEPETINPSKLSDVQTSNSNKVLFSNTRVPYEFGKVATSGERQRQMKAASKGTSFTSKHYQAGSSTEQNINFSQVNFVDTQVESIVRNDSQGDGSNQISLSQENKLPDGLDGAVRKRRQVLISNSRGVKKDLEKRADMVLIDQSCSPLMPDPPSPEMKVGHQNIELSQKVSSMLKDPITHTELSQHNQSKTQNMSSLLKSEYMPGQSFTKGEILHDFTSEANNDAKSLKDSLAKSNLLRQKQQSQLANFPQDPKTVDLLAHSHHEQQEMSIQLRQIEDATVIDQFHGFSEGQPDLLSNVISQVAGLNLPARDKNSLLEFNKPSFRAIAQTRLDNIIDTNQPSEFANRSHMSNRDNMQSRTTNKTSQRQQRKPMINIPTSGEARSFSKGSPASGQMPINISSQKFFIQSRLDASSTRHYNDEQREDWRQNVMNDKLYFLSGVSKKNRQVLQDRIPDYNKLARPKIDSRRDNMGRDIQVSIATDADKKSQKKILRNMKKNQNKIIEKYAVSQMKQGFLKAGKARDKRNFNSKSMFAPPVDMKHQPSSKDIETRMNTEASIRVPFQLRHQKVCRSTQNAPKSPPGEKVEEEKPSTNKDLLRFQDILSKSKLPDLPVLRSPSEDQSISSFAKALNSQINWNCFNQEWGKEMMMAARNASKLEDMAELNNDFEDESIDDQQLNNYISLFKEGNNGDKILKDQMTEVKDVYRNILRETNQCLKTYQGKQEQEVNLITLPTKGKSEPFKLRQCEMTNLVIENIMNRPQPVNLHFHDVRGELLVLLSTTHKFPTEILNQAKFVNQPYISFSSGAQAKSDIGGIGSPLVASPMPVAKGAGGAQGQIPRFTAQSLYITVETTQFCPQVQVTVSFGQAQLDKGTKKKKKIQAAKQKYQDNPDLSDVASGNGLLPADQGSEEEMDPAQQNFKLIVDIIQKKKKRPIEKHDLLMREVRKMLEDDVLANKFVRRIDNIKQERALTQLNERLKALQEEDALESQRDFIHENVSHADKYGELEINRRLQLLLQNEERLQESKVKREDNISQTREAAIQFLKRNEQMKEEKRIMQDISDRLRLKQKITLFFTSHVALNDLVKKRLWREFSTRRDEWKLSVRKWFASHGIQRFVRQQQIRRCGEAKRPLGNLKKDPGMIPERYEIQMSQWAFQTIHATARFSFCSICASSINIDKKQAKRILIDFLKKAKSIKSIRESFFEFKFRLSQISRSIKNYLVIKEAQLQLLINLFDREKTRISVQLMNQPDDSPFGGEFPVFIQNIPDMVKRRVLVDYNIHTQRKYNEEFFLWRQKIQQLRDDGIKDDRFGWRQPMLIQKRVIYAFSSVDYEPNLSWQMNKASLLSWSLTQKKYKYIVKARNSKMTKRPSKLLTFDMGQITKVQQKIHDRTFNLTSIKHDDDGEHARAVKRRKEELEVQEKEHEENLKLLEANPDEYTRYPDQPKRKYIPTSELMQKLIFKALEEHVGIDKIVKIFGRDPHSKGIEWTSIPGMPTKRQTQKMLSQQAEMLQDMKDGELSQPTSFNQD